MKTAFQWQVKGQGNTFGVIFVPGAALPYVKMPIRDLQDRALSFADTFGEQGRIVTEAIMAASTFQEKKKVIERFLVAMWSKPLPDPVIQAMQIFEHAHKTTSCVRVKDLEEKFAISERALQRLFDQHIGVPPRLAIKIIRFQEALRSVLGGSVHNWADFAAKLGYSDQSHFIRDFKEITGKTPTTIIPSTNLSGRFNTDED